LLLRRRGQAKRQARRLGLSAEGRVLSYKFFDSSQSSLLSPQS
jgi:hypothetical protein